MPPVDGGDGIPPVEGCDGIPPVDGCEGVPPVDGCEGVSSLAGISAGVYDLDSCISRIQQFNNILIFYTDNK